MSASWVPWPLPGARRLLEGLLANSMYRLALNDDSHMQEKVFFLIFV